MSSMLPKRSFSKGVLLMEALVALLLFMSMATIIGSYWHHLYLMRSKTHEQLQGLSIARTVAGQLMMHEGVRTSESPMLSYDYVPVTLDSDISLPLPPLSLVTIKVLYANQTVQLKMFYGE